MRKGRRVYDGTLLHLAMSCNQSNQKKYYSEGSDTRASLNYTPRYEHRTDEENVMGATSAAKLDFPVWDKKKKFKVSNHVILLTCPVFFLFFFLHNLVYFGLDHRKVRCKGR